MTDDEIFVFGTPYRNPFPYFLGPILLLLVSPAVTHFYTPRGGWRNWGHLLLSTANFLPFIILFGFPIAIVVGFYIFKVVKKYSTLISSEFNFYTFCYLIFMLPTFILDPFTSFYRSLLFGGITSFLYIPYILYSLFSLIVLRELRDMPRSITYRRRR
jgi:hypothetical protein